MTYCPKFTMKCCMFFNESIQIIHTQFYYRYISKTWIFSKPILPFSQHFLPPECRQLRYLCLSCASSYVSSLHRCCHPQAWLEWTTPGSGICFGRHRCLQNCSSRAFAWININTAVIIYSRRKLISTCRHPHLIAHSLLFCYHKLFVKCISLYFPNLKPIWNCTGLQINFWNTFLVNDATATFDSDITILRKPLIIWVKI